MKKKLTLRLDAGLIRDAKQYARAVGKPLSQLVAEYFASLPPVEIEALPPVVRSLYGCLRGASATKDDYYRYLEEKHR